MIDLSGKIVLLTGATSGIGRATASGIAKFGATLVVACRNKDKGTQLVAELKSETGNPRIEFGVADLASLEAVRGLATDFMRRFDRLDVLINNAAVVPTKREESADGFEMQFAVNHLAPFLLTNLLLDRLKGSAPARIVNVASQVHEGAVLNFDDLQSKKRYGAFGIYKMTKLCNMLFTYELARRLEGSDVTANCLHPGVVRSGLMRDLNPVLKAGVSVAGLFMLSPEKGARTSLYAATAPELEGETGMYLDNCKIVPSSIESYDESTAKRLWDISAELVNL